MTIDMNETKERIARELTRKQASVSDMRKLNEYMATESGMKEVAKFLDVDIAYTQTPDILQAAE